MTNFDERTNTLLYKNIPLTLYSKGLMLVVCERWVGDGDRLLHIDPKFFWPYQHFFRILAGLLSRGSLRAQALCLEMVLTLLASNLQLELQLPQAVFGTWLYNCLTSTCFLWAYASATITEFNHVHRSKWYSDIFDRMHRFQCSSAYLHRCISWLTARSRANMLHFFFAGHVLYHPRQSSTCLGNLPRGKCIRLGWDRDKHPANSCRELDFLLRPSSGFQLTILVAIYFKRRQNPILSTELTLNHCLQVPIR